MTSHRMDGQRATYDMKEINTGETKKGSDTRGRNKGGEENLRAHIVWKCH